jgi:hypothetical protein
MNKQKKPASRVPTVLSDTPKDKHIAIIDGPQYGFKGPDGFHQMDDYTVVGVRKDLFQRLDSAGGDKYGKQIFSAMQLVLVSRLERDFRGCTATSVMMNRKGDIALKVVGAPDGSMSSDREFLQGRLDDACTRLAECLGV